MQINLQENITVVNKIDNIIEEAIRGKISPEMWRQSAYADLTPEELQYAKENLVKNKLKSQIKPAAWTMGIGAAASLATHNPLPLMGAAGLNTGRIIGTGLFAKKVQKEIDPDRLKEYKQARKEVDKIYATDPDELKVFDGDKKQQQAFLNMHRNNTLKQIGVY